MRQMRISSAGKIKVGSFLSLIRIFAFPEISQATQNTFQRNIEKVISTPTSLRNEAMSQPEISEAAQFAAMIRNHEESKDQAIIPQKPEQTITADEQIAQSVRIASSDKVSKKATAATKGLPATPEEPEQQLSDSSDADKQTIQPTISISAETRNSQRPESVVSEDSTLVANTSITTANIDKVDTASIRSRSTVRSTISVTKKLLKKLIKKLRPFDPNNVDDFVTDEELDDSASIISNAFSTLTEFLGPKFLNAATNVWDFGKDDVEAIARVGQYNFKLRL